MEKQERNYAIEAALIKGLGVFYMFAGVILGIVVSFASVLGGITAGVATTLVGVLIYSGGKAYAKKHGVSNKLKKKDKNVAVSFFALVIVIVVCFTAFVLNGLFNSKGTTGNTCSSCGKNWSVGDNDGNYKNISKTGMCNNCEDNYQDIKQFLD